MEHGGEDLLIQGLNDGSEEIYNARRPYRILASFFSFSINVNHSAVLNY
jgi:hypothetical protein